MTAEASAAVRLADTFGRYVAHKDDWQRQSELWEEMKTLHEVHQAEKAAHAAQRLRGIIK